jgi:hypothetical protein
MTIKPARILLLVATLCLHSATIAPAAPPVIDNRAPAPDEWGYRPADGSSVRLNPPSLTWVHEPAARSYAVQWATRPDFTDAVTVDDVPWPTYTHSAPLDPGSYVWRYRFRNEAGETSGWSTARRFVVPDDAVAFPMPTRAQQRERVPAGHPRLFMRPEDLPRIREAARSTSRASFDGLLRQADRFIAAGPAPEPDHLGSARDKDNAELIRYWWPNRTQTERACTEAEVLALAALVTGEARYREAARRWVLHLASWNPDGPTNFALNCEAAKPLLYRLPRAYDWAYDALSDADRQIVRRVMIRRIDDAWNSGEVLRGVGHLNKPYSSHGNRVWHKIGEAGIACLGDVPEAATWLDYAVNKFFACYPVWSDDDGGWHEGVSYWAGYMGKAVWWLQVAQSALMIDGLKKPFFAQIGDFPLYVAPPGSPNEGFGDLSSGSPSRGWGGFLEYHLRAGGNRPEHGHAGYWRWWTEQWNMGSQPGVLGFLYEVNLGPLPPAKPPSDLPPSKVFHGIGVASLHTNLLDSRDDVHLLFKSSPFGSRSHGHNPQNSFQLNAYGDALLTTCVYRDLHGSKFHYGWAHSTVAQNAVLVDGKGQEMHVAKPQGRIVSESLTPAYDYILGDAVPAYQGRLTRCLRHVVLVKNVPTPLLVLLDDLEADGPKDYQFMLHALAPFQVDDRAATLAAQQPRAGVQVKYLAPGAVRFRQWDGYDPKPTRPFPNQWHVEAATRSARPGLAVLTVIVPYRGKSAPTWEARRVDSPDAVGVRIVVDGKPVAVAFRRPGVAGAASWDGARLEGPVLVSTE